MCLYAVHLIFVFSHYLDIRLIIFQVLEKQSESPERVPVYHTLLDEVCSPDAVVQVLSGDEDGHCDMDKMTMNISKGKLTTGCCCCCCSSQSRFPASR